MKNQILLKAMGISLLLLVTACTKKEHNVEPEITLQGSAAPVVVGHWRKMGDFFNKNCSVSYLYTIGDKAYFMVEGSSALKGSFYEYDATKNTFTAKSNIPGQTSNDYSIYSAGINLAISGKGYSRVSWTNYTGYLPEKNNKIWEYDPGADHWTRKADMFTDTLDPIGTFVMGDVGYICGWQMPNGVNNAKTYSYRPQTDQWTPQNSLFSGNTHSMTNMVFTIGSKAYMVHWINTFDALQTSEYDPSANTWTKVADFPKEYHAGHIPSYVSYPTYVLNGKGYVYCGSSEIDTKIIDNRILEFSPVTKQWQSIGDFDGPFRQSSVAFTIGSKAYIGFGGSNIDGTEYHDIWEYNP